jgi:hypothetical protein
VPYFGYVHAALAQAGARRFDVGHDEMKRKPRIAGCVGLSNVNRATGAGRGELNDSKRFGRSIVNVERKNRLDRRRS